MAPLPECDHYRRSFDVTAAHMFDAVGIPRRFLVEPAWRYPDPCPWPRLRLFRWLP